MGIHTFLRNSPTTPKKAKLLKANDKSDLRVGESVYVKYAVLNRHVDPTKTNRDPLCKITQIDGEKITILEDYLGGVNGDHRVITKEDISGRYSWFVGANPFNDYIPQIRSIGFTLESVLFGLDILGEKREDGKPKYYVGKNKDVPAYELNWNPFIYNKDGEKEYYQRPFVWSIKEKRLLIESIYENIDCGKILVRQRSWKELDKMANEGDSVVYFNDIVDGKQRLGALRDFISGTFTDSRGNYFGDLSDNAQHGFVNHTLFSYSVLPENSKDEDIVRQFLRLNFAGIPQSKEHIAFVKSLMVKITT